MSPPWKDPVYEVPGEHLAAVWIRRIDCTNPYEAFWDDENYQFKTNKGDVFQTWAVTFWRPRP